VANHEVFVVQVWAEPREPAGRPTVYRARLEQVGTDRLAYLGDLDELLPLLRRWLRASELPAGGFADDADV
jgi:hypothetical protein